MLKFLQYSRDPSCLPCPCLSYTACVRALVNTQGPFAHALKSMTLNDAFDVMVFSASN